MFKKALIISDNHYLCKNFFLILEKKSITKTTFDLAISPFSARESFNLSKTVDIRIFNLKKQADVNLIKSNFDIIFSIHCKQIFPIDLVENVKCINIHPGYNPINRGWYPQVFSIIKKLPIGATIHEIDEYLDHGRIIARDFVKKDSFDTSISLYNKILDKELELIDLHIEKILENNYNSFLPENEGNLFLKKDFNNLCKLNLRESITVGECIDKLRALSHGDYGNAYFIDAETGKKVFVSINLKVEKSE